ncbi:hypothetical protein BJ322DRAFT_135454 [Thelephora terrestris]|uniref:Uncharacterized protein n=1 Tax=Thelephora terrestris TaxID=56493 RepID=A0A9P6HBD8_9AGAM|nr:hypothetical protein BJ322DRAFT_135454 [Thelephora terrestris]
MSTNYQRDTTSPAATGGALPGTTDTHSSQLPKIVLKNVDEATQQGSTQPGDGSAVRNVVVDTPSWKERVIGYAKKYRGTMLRRPETKEHGDKILQNRATVDDPNQAPERSGHLQ